MMKKNLLLLLILLMFSIYSFGQEVYPGKAAPIEDNFPIKFPYESKYIEFGQEKTFTIL
jgi:hypothetical protein